VKSKASDARSSDIAALENWPLQMTMYTVTYITQNVRSKKAVWEEKLNSSAKARALHWARDRSLLNVHQRCRRFAGRVTRASGRVARRKAYDG
jgi:hypothetical protein